MIYKLGDSRVQIKGDDVFVAANATIIGDVTLMASCSIWYGAVVRGDFAPIVIGAGSNVQDNSVLHTDVGKPVTIGQGVTIGHNATLHGCRVDDDALIGMGATLLNSSVIAQGAMVAAQSLVGERKTIAAGQIVRGVPAKHCGEVTAEILDKIRNNALHYQELAQRHLAAVPSLFSTEGVLFKLLVLLPLTALDSVTAALVAAGARQFNDGGCQSTGALNSSTKLKGKASYSASGQLGQVKEFQLELVVPIDKIKTVLIALFNSHPDETPVFDLSPLASH